MKVTNSSLAVFRGCPRRYFYEYVRLMVPIAVSVALSIGRVMHRALEEHWRNGPTAAVKALQSISGEITEPDAAKIAAMLTYYNPPANQFEVEAVEKVFDVPIVNPATFRPMREYTLAGKVDGLIRRKSDDKLYLLEHKTTAEDILGFGPYWQRLSIDHQLSFYMVATGAEGCYYDALKKPTLKYKQEESQAAFEDRRAKLIAKSKSGKSGAKRQTGETPSEYQARCEEQIAASPEEFYQFREVHKTPQDIAEAQQDLWQQAHMLKDCHRLDTWPRDGGACRGFYGMCKYLDVCTGRARLDDETLFRCKEEQNEELGQNEKPSQGMINLVLQAAEIVGHKEANDALNAAMHGRTNTTENIFEWSAEEIEYGIALMDLVCQIREVPMSPTIPDWGVEDQRTWHDGYLARLGDLRRQK